MEIADGKSVPVIGSGLLKIMADQPEGPTTTPLGKVLNVPELGITSPSDRWH